jgi:membrane protein DedA with SNARE-associated domain
LYDEAPRPLIPRRYPSPPVPVLLASVTDSLVTFATDVVSDLGVWGVFVLMTLESACIPIPSEATMLFAGFGVSEGDHTLFAITVAGVLGNVIGSWVAYAVGYFGRVELLERHGAKLHIKPSHLEWADRWFERYGDAAVFFSRILPVIRTFISLPAGVARMPFWRFTFLTVVGCIPWVFALGLIGREVGDKWEDWKDNLHYVDLVVLGALGITVVVLVVRWWRRRGGTPAAGDAAA